jgi:FAD/FMN-containing dehydrogenase
MAAQFESWGRLPSRHERIVPFRWRSSPPPLPSRVLAVGCGRSYGDSCLNDGGTLIDMTPLGHLIEFDAASGIVRCEAGITIAELLEVSVPRGWFVPVTPGTKFVTIGGCIANDVHGKNHHRAGTFGCHVERFELLRSDGSSVICSPTENASLFEATIGGLGLTGIITWAEVRMRRVEGRCIEAETLRLRSLDEFFSLSNSSEATHEHVVAWFDSFSAPGNFRGVFFRGNHAPAGATCGRRKISLSLPVDLPPFAMNNAALRVLNRAYAAMNTQRLEVIDYEPFFYPLDAIEHWNRLYGRLGFLQYQCVIPFGTVQPLLDLFSRRGFGSFLAVLKTFGDVRSPGLMSFPRPGATIALDFPARDRRIFNVLDEADELVIAAGGRLYPAKDARMSAATFRASFPQWEEFAKYVDPKFSSNFWRRVTQ